QVLSHAGHERRRQYVVVQIDEPQFGNRWRCLRGHSASSRDGVYAERRQRCKKPPSGTTACLGSRTAGPIMAPNDGRQLISLARHRIPPLGFSITESSSEPRSALLLGALADVMDM